MAMCNVVHFPKLLIHVVQSVVVWPRGAPCNVCAQRNRQPDPIGAIMDSEEQVDQQRRTVMLGGVAALGALNFPFVATAATQAHQFHGEKKMAYFKTKDGTDIYYKDWGSGQPVVFCHGWPLNSDSWESQMIFLAAQGYRCIAHDRRGHGRSSQPWQGNDMDHYADDLHQLIELLDLKNVILFGFYWRW
jgi:non-heme chloroperoxidase